MPETRKATVLVAGASQRGRFNSGQIFTDNDKHIALLEAAERVGVARDLFDQLGAAMGEYLLERGHTVDFITPLPFAGVDLEPSNAALFLRRAELYRAARQWKN